MAAFAAAVSAACAGFLSLLDHGLFWKPLEKAYFRSYLRAAAPTLLGGRCDYSLLVLEVPAVLQDLRAWLDAHEPLERDYTPGPTESSEDAGRELEAAVTLAIARVEENPTLGSAHSDLAFVYRAMGNSEAAEQADSRAAELGWKSGEEEPRVVSLETLDRYIMKSGIDLH